MRPTIPKSRPASEFHDFGLVAEILYIVFNRTHLQISVYFAFGFETPVLTAETFQFFSFGLVVVGLL